MNNKDKLINNTLSLLELKKLGSTALYKKSVKANFKLSYKRIFFLIFLFVLCFYILYTLAFKETAALTIISDLTVNFNAVMIPIFAVLITGYAIFQALTNENTINTMLTVVSERENVSKFASYNLYFFGVICTYLILIIGNFIILIIFKYLPPDWESQLFTTKINEIIAAVLISIYVIILVNFIIEVKSYVYNLFQVFVTNATTSAIAKIESSKESISTENNNDRKNIRPKRRRKRNR
ncbi:hypothetical protein V2H29_01945 [Lysinibacillus fusiformis]|uniref:hypothetical protein n=1 Tax=Lysinibacillus TaxID=400634 RepID=UPI00232AF655|nr:hypothetical protein [Lysinibacillus sp. OF-1]MEE3805707.1 hypothetical protein [Lysinibacillus fusiformis]WCH46588.1 hypothetical protein NV349_16035 [Lysinibacillus sp. OF-1]